MNRNINQLNVSITTNRTCTLRCDHCYIEPQLFKDRTQMTKTLFKQVFDKVESLYHLDNYLEEVEWEVIGGETTMMPYEWWEKMLPYALDRISEFNQELPMAGGLNFLTNLIYKDKRYTDLFNKYAENDDFWVYTSWEPDTNRFKNKNLFKQFCDTLKSINNKNKTLDLILTKTLVEDWGAERVLDLFIPLGINDFSIKMLSPYGSGKEFFNPNMVEFDKMSQFLLDLKKFKPDNITFTPQDEIIGTFYGGSFQCNGNFKYDLTIEPDGLTHFNASQTGDEAILGKSPFYLSDPLWDMKVILNNTDEEHKKITLSHDECEDCQFLTVCNGGWYHYKVMPKSELSQWNKNECPGLKRFWEKEHKEHLLVSRDKNKIFIDLLRQKRKYKKNNDGFPLLLESAIKGGLDEWLKTLKTTKSIVMDMNHLHGYSLINRLWLYRDLGISVTFEKDYYKKHLGFIAEQIIYNNLQNINLDKEIIWEWIFNNENHKISQKMIAILISLLEYKKGHKANNKLHVNFSLDERHEEIFIWTYCNTPERLSKSFLVKKSKEVIDYSWNEIDRLSELNTKLRSAILPKQ